jgi:hypothetical protein
VACLEQRLAAPEPAPEPPPQEEPPAGAAAASASAAPPAAPPPPRPAPEPEALDLGSAVLPVLLKSYWKQAAVALVVLAVLRRLLRRR